MLNPAPAEGLPVHVQLHAAITGHAAIEQEIERHAAAKAAALAQLREHQDLALGPPVPGPPGE